MWQDMTHVNPMHLCIMQMFHTKCVHNKHLSLTIGCDESIQHKDGQKNGLGHDSIGIFGDMTSATVKKVNTCHLATNTHSYNT
jgi:hypothetical protein